METRAFFLKGLAFVFLSLFIFLPSYSDASENEILRRLEKLEREVERLKKENMELRRTRGEGKMADETARPKKAVEKDRQGITVLNKYNMLLYGRVKVDLNYDTREFRKYNDWLGAVGVGDTGNDSTNLNPRDSRIGIKVLSKNEAWTSEARIETDFYGDNNGNSFIPRMRLGYIKLTNHDWNANLLIGQDWIPIARLNPSTIDFGVLAAAGNLWWRVPQVTLRKNIGNIEILGSVMKHRRISTAEEDRMPWVLGRIAYKSDSLGKGGYVAVGAGYRRESLVDNTNGLDNDVNRWLAALELKAQAGKFTFAVEPWIGKGLDKEWLRYDMGINTYDETGTYPNRRPDLMGGVGGFASLSYLMNAKQSISLGYGIDNPRNSDMKGLDLTTVSGTNDRRFTKNEMFFINSWYSIIDAIKVGCEIMHMDTERFGDSNVGTRYTLSSMYLF